MRNPLDIFRKKPKEIQKKYSEAFIYNVNLNASGINNNYLAHSTEGYSLNFAARQAVNLVAGTSAQVLPLLYRKTEGANEEIFSHPWLDILERPNPNQSYYKFVEEATSYYKLAGETFIRVGGTGTNIELHNLRPDKVSINKAGGWGEVASYSFTDEFTSDTYKPDEIIHLKTFNPLDDYRGLSEFTSIGLELDQKNLASQWNVSILKNGGRPSFVVMSKSQLNDEQFNRLKNEIRGQYGGADNAGKIALFEGEEMEIKEVSFNANDLSWLEGQKLAVAAIATNLGVAPELVGISDAKKFANYEQAREALYTETILPWLSYFFGEMNTRLTKRFGKDLYLRPYTEKIDVLQANRHEEAKRVSILVENSVVMFGQAGMELGYDVRDDIQNRYKWEVDFCMKWGRFPDEEPIEMEETQVDDEDLEKFLEPINTYLGNAKDLTYANEVARLSLIDEPTISSYKAIQAFETKELFTLSDLKQVRALEVANVREVQTL